MMVARFSDDAHGRDAATSYERFFVPAIGRPAADQLVAAARIRPGERVLDVGCGTGIVARLAAERVGPDGAVAGLDVNPAMVAVARSVSSPGAAIEWHQAPAETMPLPDGAFDVVLCQMSLQFFQDREQGLREMHRVSAPEARVLVSLPGPMTAFFGVLAEALGRHVGAPAAGFVRQVFSLYESDEIEELLRRAGFESVEVRSAPLRLTLPGAGDFLEQYVASTPLAPLWAGADEPARSAVRRDVLAAWEPLEGERGLEVAQPMTVAVGSAPALR